MVSECVEVHNELKAQRLREAGKRQQRKRARVAQDRSRVSFLQFSALNAKRAVSFIESLQLFPNCVK